MDCYFLQGCFCYVDIMIASRVFLGTLLKVVEFFIEYLCSCEFSVSFRVFCGSPGFPLSCCRFSLNVCFSWIDRPPEREPAGVLCVGRAGPRAGSRRVRAEGLALRFSEPSSCFVLTRHFLKTSLENRFPFVIFSFCLRAYNICRFL